MNQARPDTSVRDGVLKRLKEVLAAASDQVKAMDDGGIMSRELYEQLESTGVFQALTPKMYGGLELSLQDVNEALIEGGRVSGSIGWVMMIHTQQSLGMGAFPKETGLRLLR
jgi:alkylation response protein AidB-like acyl-CoA dehydrogenase